MAKRSKSTPRKRPKSKRGCCTVYFNGSKMEYGKKTENQCAAIARNYPGATYDFKPGACEGSGSRP